ncbi:alpha/beta fold hydrolase [Catellatospora tritici]|uniref:alpha/beta fold hydrolase n=1 Tax=Catellatospora tritici TaxID=2851566 RepID=UPI001C2D4040|nr:alpha/beta hydrolase [Catellatospora tritici]MBV1849425.1 alpha/beta fold hydrolase [Catellatospora tritici]
MPHRWIRVNGGILCVQTFGAPTDPALLLIAGSAAPMTVWEDEFCQELADAGHHVVRFDQRDTGRSSVRLDSSSLADLVDDAVGLLDALDLKRAHVVGASMGGMVAQLLALDHPDRVATLTLIASSPAAPGADDSDLPPPSLRVRAELDDVDLPDWDDPASAAIYLVELATIRAGVVRPLDEDAARRMAERIVAHSADLATAMHRHSELDYGSPWRKRLGEVAVPVLVVHGGADPVLPVAHAWALARALPQVEVLVMPEAGHDLDRVDWPVVIPALLRHTAPR